MKIYSLWFWRRDDDFPEMLTAWDEWSVEQNPTGWQEDCQKKYQAVKEDDVGGGPREIHFQVNSDEVEKAFYPVVAKGEVV